MLLGSEAAETSSAAAVGGHGGKRENGKQTKEMSASGMRKETKARGEPDAQALKETEENWVVKKQLPAGMAR